MANLKKIVNLHEEATYNELKAIASEFEYQVYIKVRVADVLPLDQAKIASNLYSFALKSHFDFLACDKGHNPVFAVEFDGPSHQEAAQLERDRKKDSLCKMFDLPILRINNNHLLKRYNRASLLRWIVSAWELQKDFEAGQRNGQVPAEEDFDPIWAWRDGKTIEEVRPYAIALKPRLHIEKLHKAGRLPRSGSSGFVFTDEKDTYIGIEWIDVAEDRVVVVESAMRPQQFPLHLGQLFDELMTVMVYDKLLNYLKKGVGDASPSEVEARFAHLMSRYELAASHTVGGTSVNVAMTWDAAAGRWRWATGKGCGAKLSRE